MKYFSYLMLLYIASGCSTVYYDVNERGSKYRNNECLQDILLLPGMVKNDCDVYCSNGQKTSLEIKIRGYLIWEDGIKLYWKPQNNKQIFGGTIDPYRISQKCKPYIINGYFEKITYEQYEQIYKGKLKCPESEYIQMPREFLKSAFETDNLIAAKIDKEYWIVCIEPVVVIALDGSNISWNRIFSYQQVFRRREQDPCLDRLYFRKNNGYFYVFDPLNGYTRQIWDFNTTMANGLTLPYGLDYGLELPYVENPRWFSPDMKVKDQPVEMISETKGQIRVPWGYLYLTKNDDKWIVTAEKK